METLICEKIQRITKNRERLEKVLEVKITNKGKEENRHNNKTKRC